MASKSARIMDAALASGAMAFMLDDWITKSYNRPSPDILDLQRVDPPTAAMLLRQHSLDPAKPKHSQIKLLDKDIDHAHRVHSRPIAQTPAPGCHGTRRPI